MGVPVSDIQKLEPTAVLEFFILDLNPIGISASYYFHSGTNQFGGSVVWQGVTYQPWPITASGFEFTSQGTIPRPKVVVSNLDGSIGVLVRQYGDLVGARLTRKRTLSKYLDAVNFTAGNANADPNSCFPDDIYTINQKTAEEPQSGTIEWELRASMDLEGYLVPRRVMQAQMCGWRSTDTAICTYANNCGKKISDCKAKWGTAKLPFGGFPGLGLTSL